MAKNDFSLNVLSKFFKPIGIDSWQSTKVTLDEQNGKLTICFEAQQCTAPIQTFQLSEFRTPKPSSKKSPPGSFIVELRGRSVFTQTRIIQFQTTNKDTYNLFFSALQSCYSTDKKVRDTRGTRQIGSAQATPAANYFASPEAEADEFINGVYATVGGVNETEEEFLFCESKIHEAFDVDRCFAASLEDYTSSYGGSVKSLGGVSKGDEVCLYIAHKHLELLSKDAKQLMASWPFKHIKNIGVSKMTIKTVRLEFAERTCTGRATLTFRPCAGSSSERDKNFLERLVACIVTPPPPKCYCRSAAGNGQYEKQLARRRQNTADGGATEDDDDDEDDDEGNREGEDDSASDSRRPQVPATETENSVYALVQHEKDETASSSSSSAPALPPHPTSIAASAARTVGDATITAPVKAAPDAVEASSRKQPTKSRPPPPPPPPTQQQPPPKPLQTPQVAAPPIPKTSPPPIPQTTRQPPNSPPIPQTTRQPPNRPPFPPQLAVQPAATQPRQPYQPPQIDDLDDGGGYATAGDFFTEDTV